MEFKKVISTAVDAYIRELTGDGSGMFEDFTVEEKKQWVKEKEGGLDEEVASVVGEFDPEICMKKYATKEHYDYFVRNRDLYNDWAVEKFEYEYRSFHKIMIEVFKQSIRINGLSN